MFDYFRILKKQKETIESLEAELNDLRQLDYYVRTNCDRGAYECLKHKQYHKIWVSVFR